MYDTLKMDEHWKKVQQPETARVRYGRLEELEITGLAWNVR